MLLEEGSAYTHPIYSISYVGNKNFFEIVSSSSNGQVCVWASETLSNPMSFRLNRQNESLPAKSAGIKSGLGMTIGSAITSSIGITRPLTGLTSNMNT